MNPAIAFPLPAMVHDGEDRTADGAAVSRHDVSVVNPVPKPETGVPADPNVGVSVKVPGGPEVTTKPAVATLPAFEVTVTVYEVPGDTPEATVNPPDSVPDESEHIEETNRLDGTAVMIHVVPK